MREKFMSMRKDLPGIQFVNIYHNKYKKGRKVSVVTSTRVENLIATEEGMYPEHHPERIMRWNKITKIEI